MLYHVSFELLKIAFLGHLRLTHAHSMVYWETYGINPRVVKPRLRPWSIGAFTVITHV